MRSGWSIRFSLAFLCSLSVSTAFAQSLDTSFGTNGLVIPDLGDSVYAKDAILQSDGKIVIVATSPGVDPSGSYVDPSRDIIVWRLNPDGTPDALFGQQGVVRIDFASGEDRAGAIRQQPDGKLVVLGSTMAPTGDFDYGIARLRTDGSLDPSFNSTGKLTVNFIYQTSSLGITITHYKGNDLGIALALLPDGGMIAIGTTDCSATTLSGGCDPSTSVDVLSSRVSLVKISDDGAIENSYGPNGDGSFQFPGFITSANAVALLSDGNIILGTGSSVTHVDTTSAFATINGLSSPDFSTLYTQAILPTSVSFLLGGSARLTSGRTTSAIQGIDQALALTGSSTFDVFGEISGETAFSSITALLSEPGSKILATGYKSRTSGSGSPVDAMIVRQLANGQRDPYFATNGILTVSFDGDTPVHSAVPVAILRMTDGKLVVVANRGDSLAGPALAFGSQRVALVRLNSTPRFAFSASSFSVTEGAGSILIGVTRNGNASTPVSIDYETADGTATAGNDFTAITGTVTWQPGDTDTKTIAIPITNDGTQESQEAFSIRLLNPSEGSIDNATTTVTITDDDSTSHNKNGGGGTFDWFSLVVLLGSLTVARRANLSLR